MWDAGEVLVAPTETTDGSKKYTCTVCGDTKTVVTTLAEVIDGFYYYNNKNNGILRKNETFTIAANKTNGLIPAGKYTADENGVLTPAS